MSAKKSAASNEFDAFPLQGRINGEILPRVMGATVSVAEVRALLARVGTAFPETTKVMATADQMLVHLEGLRQHALLGIDLGQPDVARRTLKQAALVEVKSRARGMDANRQRGFAIGGLLTIAAMICVAVAAIMFVWTALV